MKRTLKPDGKHKDVFSVSRSTFITYINREDQSRKVTQWKEQGTAIIDVDVDETVAKNQGNHLVSPF